MNTGSIFFTLALAGLATAYAFTMRSRVVDLQDELSTARAAAEVNARTVATLKKEIELRDEVIAKRDARLAAIERQADFLQTRLEEVSKHEDVQAWAGCDVPADVLRLLESYTTAYCPTGKGAASGSVAAPD